MPEYQISLPEELYSSVLAAANANGISPVEWIASKLPTTSLEISNKTSISDLIGAINSQNEPNRDYETTSFGESITAKLAKQGIERP